MTAKMTTKKTYMQELSDSVKLAVENEPGKSQLAGYDKTSIIATVAALTGALDGLPPTTNMHVVLFSLNYVRNAIILAMEDNQRQMEATKGPKQ